jgi:hypothetical protein
VFFVLGNLEKGDTKKKEEQNKKMNSVWMKNVASLFKNKLAALSAPGKIYTHYKGGIYRVLYQDVKHTKDDSVNGRLVVYEHLWPNSHQIYARPHEMFHGRTDDGQKRFRLYRKINEC